MTCQNFLNGDEGKIREMLMINGVELVLFHQALEVWEQGRFIRFHGLSLWPGWLWPFAALWFGLRAVARPPRGGAAVVGIIPR